MHFQLVGLPVLSQKLIVKHYIIQRSPKPNCQLSFGILSQLAISENNSYAVSKRRLAFHKFFPATAPRVLRKQILALLLLFGHKILFYKNFFRAEQVQKEGVLQSRTGRMLVERRHLIEMRLFSYKGEVYILLPFFFLLIYVW